MSQDSQPSVLVRPRRESDIAAAAAGLVRVHALDGCPVEGVSQPESWLTPTGMIASWVAEISGLLAGHVVISRPMGEEAVSLWLEQSHDAEDKVAVLARLFVLPEARQRSIGERLMGAAVAYANRHGIRLVLDVLFKDAAAIRLYERTGWEGIGNGSHAFGAAQEAAALCFVSPVDA
jgi:GNAT superfamily N-acetyltransferase